MKASRLTLWLRSFWLGRLFVEYRLGWQLGCSHREAWRVAKIMASVKMRRLHGLKSS
jgi:hypothetical protein